MEHDSKPFECPLNKKLCLGNTVEPPNNSHAHGDGPSGCCRELGPLSEVAKTMNNITVAGEALEHLAPLLPRPVCQLLTGY